MFDSPQHVLHVGGNLAQELDKMLTLYSNTLKSITYIECIPSVYEALQRRLAEAQTKTHVKLQAVCALVTDVDGKEYDFHISSNEGQSSSIFPPNFQEWAWDCVQFTGIIKLISTTIDTLVKQNQLEGGYDTLVLDTQGSELQVLKGMVSTLRSIHQIQTEFSKREFYSGGVLIRDLVKFLEDKGFELSYIEPGNHGDMVLTGKSNAC
jgi:FkbM family methyltransferase